MQTEDLQAQLNTETAVLKLINKQMTDLLSRQADLNAHIVKLSMQISQERQERLLLEWTAKIPDLLVLTDKKDLKFEDWLPCMRVKMRTNKDYYSDNNARMMYILS
jgi:hypothetical protein